MSVDRNIDAPLPTVAGLDAAALKAVRNSMPGKLIGRTAALLATVVLVLGFAEIADNRLIHLGLVLSPTWLNPVLLMGIPITVIVAQLLNEVVAARNRRAAQDLAIKPAAVHADYFRIGPYLDTEEDRKAFTRVDRAHERVLAWLRQSALLPLYLTGDSGSGKSSLLNAFVLPSLRKDDWAVAQVRVAQDADTALRVALTPSDCARADTLRNSIEAYARRCGDRLLLVLDQFEEFVLASPESQQAFAAVLADLQQNPVEGLKILLVVRSDYQATLEEIGLPRLLQAENFFPVGRFREESARNFMRDSNLGLKSEALDRLLKSAAELDDTPGMIRPITLNVLGYLLHQRGGTVASSVDAGQIVRDYITQTIESPAIRAWAPAVLEGLLTKQGTKRPRREAELAAGAKLRPAETRAVLNALAVAALARPLEAAQGTWELSHDFVAHAVNHYLQRRRGALVRSMAGYAAPVLLALGLVAFSAVVEWNLFAPNLTRAKLAESGILVQTTDGSLTATATSSFEPKNFYLTIPQLSELAVQTLDLGGTQVANLDPLKGLTALKTLYLTNTQVANLDPLKGADRASDARPVPHAGREPGRAKGADCASDA